MNVINTHLVGYRETTESHVISFHGVVSTCSYQRISLQNILFYLQYKKEREREFLIIYYKIN